MMEIPLIKPYITKEIKKKVCEVFDSGYLTEGPVTKKFEEAVRAYIDCKHAIAVTFCTTGLEMALVSSLERNHSLRTMDQINRVIDWSKVAAGLEGSLARRNGF